MIKDTITLQLVTLAVIDEDGFLDVENKEVGCIVLNSDHEYVTMLPLQDAIRLCPNACLDDFVNPRTKEVYQSEEIITLYEHEGHCYATYYNQYTSDCVATESKTVLSDMYYHALEELRHIKYMNN